MIEREDDWLSSTDPQAMLNYLEGKTTPRKLRLFACALARRCWPLLRDPRSRAALEGGERFADGRANDIEIESLREPAQAAVYDAPLFLAPAHEAAWAVTEEDALEAARAAVRATRQQAVRDAAYSGVPGRDEQTAVNEAIAAESVQQCEVVRHVFGNPFRPSPIAPAWLRWNDGIVVKIARLIYDEGRFEEMLFLADALADAGCCNEAILSHGHSHQEHVRGCWLLDGVLQQG
jgi:hypothetical protein